MKKIGPSGYLIIFILAFMIGIFFGSFFKLNWLILIISWIILIIISIIFWRDEKVRILSLSAILVLVGLLYFLVRAKTSDPLTQLHNQNLTIIGQIADEPDIRGDQIKLTIQAYQISQNGQNFQKTSGKLLATLERYPEFELGEWLEIKGELKEPKIYPDFNYQNYLAGSDIFSTSYQPEIKTISKPSEISQNSAVRFWFSLKKSLFWVKAKFVEKIAQILPEPQSSFLAGLLVGAKRAIPQNLYDAFVRTGTIHIVVISGFNITIIARAFMRLTRRWSKKLATILAIVGIILFTIMVGGEAPAVRAAIMAGIVIWGERISRKSDITVALLVAALIMMLLNPKVLKSDIGFQLSFLATAGLIYFSPLLEAWLKHIRLKKFLPKIIKEPLIATLSAQIMVIPIILFNFNRISLISPLANILILPAIPLTMLLGFITVIGGFWWLGLGQTLGWISWLFLTYQIKIVEFLSQIPKAQIEFKFSWFWVFVYFLILGLVIWRQNRKLKLKII